MTSEQEVLRTVVVSNPDRLLALLGNHDKHIKLLESQFPVQIANR